MTAPTEAVKTEYGSAFARFTLPPPCASWVFSFQGVKEAEEAPRDGRAALDYNPGRRSRVVVIRQLARDDDFDVARRVVSG